MKRLQILASVLGLMLFLAGCSKEIENVSNVDLREKWRECQRTKDPGPAMIFACNNYEKECERRREELKRNVC